MDNAGGVVPELAEGVVPEIQLDFQYDFEGNRTWMGDSLGGNIGYTWANQRLQSMRMTTAENKAAQVDFGHDSIGRLSSVSRMTNDNHATTIDTAYTLDLLDRVTSITHQKVGVSTNTLSQFSYSYDANGRVVSSAGPEGTLSFALDANGQLLSVTGSREESYGYDANGNRSSSATGAGNLLLNDSQYSYTYDFEGNRKTRIRLSDGQITEYYWDHRNQLTLALVKDANGVTLKELRFTYDVEGRRVGVWTDSDGAGPLAADQGWMVFDGVNPYLDLNAEGQLTTRYLHGPGIDELFARIGTGEDPEWYLTDRLGSVRQIVDGSGTILDEITYDSYGNILSETNPNQGDRFKFTGREFSAELGIYYYRARWYDPAIGQFISQDPIGFSAGDPNLYRYVGNRPGDGTDPEGLQTTLYEPYLDKRFENPLIERQKQIFKEPWRIPYIKNPSAQAAFDQLWVFVYSQSYWVAFQDPCFKWAGEVNRKLPPEFGMNTSPLKVKLVSFKVTGENWVNGHMAFEVKFPDGQIIYFDEGGFWSTRAGALGGGDRWFHPNEIPPNYIQVFSLFEK